MKRDSELEAVPAKPPHWTEEIDNRKARRAREAKDRNDGKKAARLPRRFRNWNFDQ